MMPPVRGGKIEKQWLTKEPANKGPKALPSEAKSADKEFIVDLWDGKTVLCMDTNKDASTEELNTREAARTTTRNRNADAVSCCSSSCAVCSFSGTDRGINANSTTLTKEPSIIPL
mmetsp:Transcript_26056/g.37372  ORF Transcript_26056/g.37372 Transcript_26056/m.37372 type:complete len:116 (-) Transcript_26056:208-555(-)